MPVNILGATSDFVGGFFYRLSIMKASAAKATEVKNESQWID
jgi:hypothetical protein